MPCLASTARAYRYLSDSLVHTFLQPFRIVLVGFFSSSHSTHPTNPTAFYLTLPCLHHPSSGRNPIRISISQSCVPCRICRRHLVHSIPPASARLHQDPALGPFSHPASIHIRPAGGCGSSADDSLAALDSFRHKLHIHSCNTFSLDDLVFSAFCLASSPHSPPTQNRANAPILPIA